MEEWTGAVIGKMHNNRITFDMLADKMGVTKAYISMCLNCKRKPPLIRQRIEKAVDELIAEKN